MSRVYKNSSRIPRVELFKAFVSFIKFRIAVRRKDQARRLKHVLELLEHLNGDYPVRSFVRLKAANFSNFALHKKHSLPTLLSKTKKLKSLPKNSLGRLYYELNEGKEDYFKTLSSNMPTDRYTDEYALFLRRSLDVHDMVHIVMDFDRDLFSEGNVLVALSCGGSSPYWKWCFIWPTLLTRLFDGRWKFFILACRIVLRETPSRCASVDNWDLIHWEKLLDKNIEEIRAELSISSPVLYQPGYILASEER
tara:strand:+ start:970 stop:1722 length:753 start_codon:yes stop_codon:yes gene_type:complete